MMHCCGRRKLALSPEIWREILEFVGIAGRVIDSILVEFPAAVDDNPACLKEVVLWKGAMNTLTANGKFTVSREDMVQQLTHLALQQNNQALFALGSIAVHSMGDVQFGHWLLKRSADQGHLLSSYECCLLLKDHSRVPEHLSQRAMERLCAMAGDGYALAVLETRNCVSSKWRKLARKELEDNEWLRPFMLPQESPPSSNWTLTPCSYALCLRTCHAVQRHDCRKWLLNRPFPSLWNWVRDRFAANDETEDIGMRFVGPMRACAVCHTTRYCSKVCQHLHHRQHRRTCREMEEID